MLLLVLTILCSTAAQARCNPNLAITHTGTTCVGADTLILTGTDAGSQISWYSDTTIVSIGADTTYIPTAAGTYHAVVSAGICTDTTTSLIVSALPIPTLQAQGALTRCAGDSVRLTAGGGATYLWSNGDTAHIIYAHIAGIYDVTVTNAAGCSAISRQDTVRFTPTVQPEVTIQSDYGDSICLNTNVTFYATSVNEGSNPQYQWKRNGVNITNTATYIGTLLQDGDVISVVLLSNATCAVPRRDTDAITITVLPLPAATISSSAALCGGDTVTLTAAAAATYDWSTGDSTQSISVTASGSYGVTVTDHNGCSAGAVPFTVAPVTSTEATITQTGDSLYTTSAQFYQWYYNGTIIPNATGPVVALGHSGYYQVATIDSNGCRSLSSVDTILIAGVNDIAVISGTKVYPNPSTGAFTISWSDETARDIRIMDAIGDVVREETAVTARSRSYDLSNFSTGIYYVQISQGAMSRTAKVSIIR